MSFSILYIITRLDRGGTVDVITSLAQTAQERGNKVTIIAGLTDDGIKIAEEFKELDIVFMKELKRDIVLFSDFIAFFKMFKFMVKNRFTIVHTHTSKAGILGRMAAFLARVPIVIHTPHGHVFRGYFSKLKSKIIVLTEKISAYFADLLIGISEGEIEETINFGVGNKKKFELVRTGIFFPSFDFIDSINKKKMRKEFNFNSEDIILGFMGRLEHIKGIDILIESFNILSKKNGNLKFLLCGDGSMRKLCEEKSKKYGLESKIVFTGWREDTWNLLSIMDLLVIPSRMEGMGKSAIEAIFMNCPVVAAGVGGLNSIINEEKYGLLVTPLNAEVLSEKIIELINNIEDYQKIKIDRKKIKKKYDNRYMVERMFNIYRRLIIEKRIKE